ncbi:MAG: hypothetical protein CL916_01145 [Deltaproteobacteria bacterium]|nr:hypothetical protein [Deltaproteobacteria bacterium]
MSWTFDFERVPDEPWTKLPLEELAMKYDTVEEHGWYDNLIPTVNRLIENHKPEELILDYSGGTGILVDRLFRSKRPSPNVLIVDSSPKFLRLALEKNKNNEKVGFRLIRYLREKRRLQFLEEVLGDSFYNRKADGLVSTNAIHLYYQLPQTLRSWREALRIGAKVHIQSGNIRNPDADPGVWIIDETVEAIHQTAMKLVRDQEEYAALRPLLENAAYMEAHDALRKKYFLPVRPRSFYTESLCEAGFAQVDTSYSYIDARVDQWYDFLVVYHEGVLGWVGGAQKITKKEASYDEIALRKALMWKSMQTLFSGKETFQTVWTYLNFRNTA